MLKKVVKTIGFSMIFNLRVFPSLTPLGAQNWCLFGASGTLWGLFGVPWAPLGLLLGASGPPLGDLGALLSSLWAPLGLQGPSHDLQISFKLGFVGRLGVLWAH